MVRNFALGPKPLGPRVPVEQVLIINRSKFTRFAPFSSAWDLSLEHEIITKIAKNKTLTSAFDEWTATLPECSV